MPSVQTQVININDKKLESLNGSFNLTMNIVPITPSEPESMKPQTHNQIVKEEQLEEEEDDIKCRKIQLIPASLISQSLNDTAVSTNLDQS